MNYKSIILYYSYIDIILYINIVLCVICVQLCTNFNLFKFYGYDFICNFIFDVLCFMCNDFLLIITLLVLCYVCANICAHIYYIVNTNGYEVPLKGNSMTV